MTPVQVNDPDIIQVFVTGIAAFLLADDRTRLSGGRMAAHTPGVMAVSIHHRAGSLFHQGGDAAQVIGMHIAMRDGAIGIFPDHDHTAVGADVVPVQIKTQPH